MKFQFFRKICTLLVSGTLALSCLGFTASAAGGTGGEVSGAWTIPTDSSITQGSGKVFCDTVAADGTRHDFSYSFTGDAEKQYVLDMTFSLEGSLYGANCELLYLKDTSGNNLGMLYATWTGQFFFQHKPDVSGDTATCAEASCGVITKTVQVRKIDGAQIKFRYAGTAAVKAYTALNASKSKTYAVRVYVDNEQNYFTVAVKDVTYGDTDFTYAEHKTKDTDTSSHTFRFPLDEGVVFGGAAVQTPNLLAGGKYSVDSFKIRECYTPEITGASVSVGAKDVAVDTALSFTADSAITAGLDQIKIYADGVSQSFSTAPFSLSSDKKTLTYTGSLSYATQYKFEIPQGALDSDGMAFGAYSLSFTTEAAPENFYDGFENGTLSEFWDVDADKNGTNATLNNGVLTINPARSTKEGRENEYVTEEITFKPGGNTGEYWADARISLKGTIKFQGQNYIQVLGNSGALLEVYITGGGEPYFSIEHNVGTKYNCHSCGVKSGATQVYSRMADEPGTADGNTVLYEDEYDIRFYVNTTEGYITAGMKKAGDTSYNYATHKDAQGKEHPVEIPIAAGETLTGLGFATPIFTANGKNAPDADDPTAGTNTAQYTIHSASIRKYIHSEIESSTVSRNEAGVPVSRAVSFTFTKPMTAGLENIKVYENGDLLPETALALSSDQLTLSLTAPLKYSSAYEIKIPGEGVEWNGMLFKEDSFSFTTEHRSLGVTAGASAAVDAAGQALGDLNTLTPGTTDEVKAQTTINSTTAQTVTVISVLYKQDGGKRVIYDIIAETKTLTAGANLFTSTGALKLPETAAERSGLSLKVYIWDTLTGMRSVNTYTH